MSRFNLLLLLPLLALAPLLALGRYLWNVAADPAKALRIAMGFDRLANAALNGLDTETISARAARGRQEGRAWGCLLCRLLDRLQPGHCDQALGTVIDQNRGE